MLYEVITLYKESIMSQTMKFECPECQTFGEHTMQKRVRISKTPQLKDAILNGTYFEWVCPGCAKHFFMDDVFLYSDDENKFMVYLVPGYEKETLPVPTLLKTDSDYDTEHSTLRVTAGFIDFAEKIRIRITSYNVCYTKLLRSKSVSMSCLVDSSLISSHFCLDVNIKTSDCLPTVF